LAPLDSTYNELEIPYPIAALNIWEVSDNYTYDLHCGDELQAYRIRKLRYELMIEADGEEGRVKENI